MISPRSSLWSPALGLVAATLFFGALGPNLLIPASAYLGAHGYDQQQIGLIMGAFNVASLLAMTQVGRMVAALGHARVLALAGLFMAGGAIVFGASTALPGFAAGRALQGIGLGTLLVAAGAYVVEIAPPERLGEALGISGILTLTAQAVGPSLADSLQRATSWQTVFWLSAGVAVLASLVSLALPRVIGGLRTGPAALRRAWATLVATMFAGLGFGAIWTFLGDYARSLGGIAVGWFFTSYVIAAVASRVLLGSLSDRIGRQRAAAPALLGHAIIFVVLAMAHAPWHLAVVGVGYGLCHGVYYPTMQALVVERAGGTRSTAVAAATFAFGVGIVIAAWGLGPVARAAGYPALYITAAVTGVVAAVLVWWRG